MVKLSAAALFLALATTADAFKPTAFVRSTNKIVTPALDNDWRPGMKMTGGAGGAEKAYGEEYYEGKLFLLTSLRLASWRESWTLWVLLLRQAEKKSKQPHLFLSCRKDLGGTDCDGAFLSF